MSKLGVNIDHVATLRQARQEFDPDPVMAAEVCEAAGADSIVAHLREDRRHINDNDIVLLRKKIKTKFNLEMSINKDIVDIACRIVPDEATLVPEKRKELTTEGGLDVVRYFTRIKKVVQRLHDKGIEVSLFIDPDKEQIDKAVQTGARIIELHTGEYARMTTKRDISREFNRIKKMAEYANSLGLRVNAGHGLKYNNTSAIAGIKTIEELNIGHSIISYAVFVGLSKAVIEMKRIIRSASGK